MYKYGKMGENAKKIWAKAAAESKYRKRFQSGRSEKKRDLNIAL